MKTPDHWDSPAASKLWLYNLHYFDDLSAVCAAERREWHQSLVARWIDDNPPAQGVGWEPYPLSLRIVNWVKWGLAGNTLDETARHSLAIQARYLSKRLEYHLLGNHLLANAKALIFAGLYFDGAEAHQWLDKGQAILKRELREQVLRDGGHFERSPMYHHMVLEDALDLVNIFHAYGWDVPGVLHETIPGMVVWAETMIHPDGDIAFFNDAAFGMAPTRGALRDYAERLNLYWPRREYGDSVLLPESGYARLESGPYTALIDVAPLGPDYLPGHGHADSLSFELSVGDSRMLVNSGVSQYGEDEERLRQRGTAAHNTVRIDGVDSSEVWAGFRVARRARIHDVRFDPKDRRISAWHDGYCRLPGRPVHRRGVAVDSGGVEIVDEITGDGAHDIEGFLHLHPDMRLVRVRDAEGEFQISSKGSGFSGPQRLIINGADCVRVEHDAEWHPEFGRTIQTSRIVYACSGVPPFRIRTLIGPQQGPLSHS